MMQMLAAGGIAPVTDGIRTPDEDNPRGFYESERIKQLHIENHWLTQIPGRAVKIVSKRLVHIPHDGAFNVIFMHRNMDEILTSQRIMIERRGGHATCLDDEIRPIYEQHLAETIRLLNNHPNANLLILNYNQLLDAPETHIELIRNALCQDLDTAAMAGAIDLSLYRQKG